VTGAAPGEGAARAPRVRERPLAVGVYLGFAALVGLAWSAPLAAALGAAVGAYPRGDAELFDPGGVLLLEAARRLRDVMPAIGAAWLVLAVVALPLGVVVLAFCIAQLGVPGDPRPSSSLVRAVRSVPTLVLVQLVALVGGALVIALVMLGGGSIVRTSWPEAPPRDIARWSLIGIAFVLVSAIGVVHDLARAAAVTGPTKTYAALRAALLTARRRPGRAAWSYTWRALLGLVSMGVAASVGVHIGKVAPGAVVAMALVHQVGVAAMGWLRLSWLAEAARLVAPEVAAPAAEVSAGPAAEVLAVPAAEVSAVPAAEVEVAAPPGTAS
jgi:hypothetical protein